MIQVYAGCERDQGGAVMAISPARRCRNVGESGTGFPAVTGLWSLRSHPAHSLHAALLVSFLTCSRALLSGAPGLSRSKVQRDDVFLNIGP